MTRADPAVVHIDAAAGHGSTIADAWRSRELLLFLVERDLRVRYKQTIFGAGWAIAQPLISMVLFALVFGRLAGLPSEGVPYPLFALSGTVMWTLVSSGVTTASSSLVTNQSLIKKVFIHKMLVPAAALFAHVVDLLLALVVLIGVATLYGYAPTARLLVLLPLVLLGVAVSLGVALALAATNVIFRDVRFVVPYGVQAWLFLTPVAYSLTAVDASVRPWFALNPFVGVIEGTRWAVLGTSSSVGGFVLASCAGAGVLLLAGGLVFRRLEPLFADVV